MALLPRPKSPPELYGKRRELAKVVMLEREISFLQEELKSIETVNPVSSCIKEVADYVVTTPEPLITVCSRSSKSCGFWKWLLCGKSCFDISCLCCCCYVNDCCSLETPRCCVNDCCSVEMPRCCVNDCCSVEMPRCCCCSLPRDCCSWSIPKCTCACKPPSCPAPSCPNCNSGCCKCKVCWPTKCSCSCWPTKCTCWPTKCSCWPTKCSCWPTKCTCWPTKCTCWPTKCTCWPTKCSWPKLPKCSSCSLENNCCYSSCYQCCCC